VVVAGWRRPCVRARCIPTATGATRLQSWTAGSGRRRAGRTRPRCPPPRCRRRARRQANAPRVRTGPARRHHPRAADPGLGRRRPGLRRADAGAGSPSAQLGRKGMLLRAWGWSVPPAWPARWPPPPTR
jgi:hypothetical protein